MKKRPVIIIGGGPAGAATALRLLRSGVQPLIIERESFPRFHIGESLLPYNQGIFREMLDQELSRQIAFAGGFGIGDMLYQQLKGK